MATPQPWVLILPICVTGLLLATVWRLSLVRDIGAGLIPDRDRSPLRMKLLGSIGRLSLRVSLGGLAVWAAAITGFGVVVGTLSSATGNGAISASLRREFEKLGEGSISTPTGYLALSLLIFMVAISCFACAQLGFAGREELEGRLETLIAQPVSRPRWFAARLGIAAGGIGLLSLLTVTGAWIGTLTVGASVGAGKMALAGVNFLPVTLLFLGVAALAYAFAPRRAALLAYGTVMLSFLWDLLGSLLSVPRWLLQISPFYDVGKVPVSGIMVRPAFEMAVIAAVAIVVSVFQFGRRDLVGE